MRPIEPLDSRFTFGCDPELFIVDKFGNPKPAENFIPGSKENPYLCGVGAVQVDGLAAEFNIHPVKDYYSFSAFIERQISLLQDFLPSRHRLINTPALEFEEDVLAEVSAKNLALGCDPDFNAWVGGVNPPVTLENPNVRCIGGHLHIGWRTPRPVDAAHVSACNDLVKQLDWYLGAWANEHDHDTVRKSLYGKAGACRYKPYGVEYRVLSSFWVLDEELRLQVWNRMQQAIIDMADRFLPEALSPLNDALVNYINTGDSVFANHVKEHIPEV